MQTQVIPPQHPLWRRRRFSLLLPLLFVLALAVELAFVAPGITRNPGGGSVASCDVAQPTGDVTLFGHLIPALRALRALRPTDCNQPIHLAIALQMRDKHALDAFLNEVNDPTSPNYHHFLSPTELAERFGQPQAAIDAMLAYLQSHGFSHVQVVKDHLLIDATGTVGMADRAFAVHIADFSFAGRTVYAPTNEPSLPAPLATMTLNIAGMDDVARAHPIP